uniref:ARAD1D27632p n=1 Tax=Blastobotrys adeninivorans TaxID=409370 RepID=A0A060TH22_BLAAD
MSSLANPLSPMLHGQDHSRHSQDDPYFADSGTETHSRSSMPMLSRLQASWHNYTHRPPAQQQVDQESLESYDESNNDSPDEGEADSSVPVSDGPGPSPATLSASLSALSSSASTSTIAPTLSSSSSSSTTASTSTITPTSSSSQTHTEAGSSGSSEQASQDAPRTLLGSVYRPGQVLSAISASFLHKEPRGYARDNESEKVTMSYTEMNARSSGRQVTNDEERRGSASSVSSSESGYSTPIVRKKSGERVKSSLKLPGLVRTQSLPSTPSKMVHFDANLEQIRRFSRMDQPQAVSEQNSPAEGNGGVEFHWGDSTSSSSESDSDMSSDDESENEHDYPSAKHHSSSYWNNTEWSIDLPNFVPPELTEKSGPVVVENILLSPDKSCLVGHVLVKNLSFEKSVVARYTVDYWRTAIEVFATYNDDIRRRARNLGYDRFSFVINLSDLPQHALRTKSLFFCVRFSANGTDYWDNNNTFNYQVDFSRQPKPGMEKNVRGHRRHHRRSRQTDRESSPVHRRSQSHPNFGHFSMDDGMDYFNSKPAVLFSPALAPVVGGPVETDLGPKKQQKAKVKKLTSRYSFGASFRQTNGNSSSIPDYDETTDDDDNFTFPKTSSRVASPPAAQPAWDSLSYQDILNKYCFFGNPSSSTDSKKTTTSVSSNDDATDAITDATQSLELSTTGSTEDSHLTDKSRAALSSPVSPTTADPLIDGHEFMTMASMPRRKLK